MERIDCRTSAEVCQKLTLPKKQRVEGQIEDKEGDDNDGDNGTGLRFLLDAHSIKLIGLPATWEHPDTKTKMYSIAIILPSGIGQGQLEISEENGGNELKLTVSWPKALFNIDKLLTEKLRQVDSTNLTFSKFHPMYLAFENALRTMRN